MKSESEIKKEIKTHIDSEGSEYNTWYVGVSLDGRNRLKQHRVDLEEGKAWWIFRVASNDEIARNIEKYFIELGCYGSEGGGDKESTHVYAYKKTVNTYP